MGEEKGEVGKSGKEKGKGREERERERELI